VSPFLRMLFLTGIEVSHVAPLFSFPSGLLHVPVFSQSSGSVVSSAIFEEPLAVSIYNRLVERGHHMNEGLS